MQLTSYAAFREAVRTLIEGDEIGSTFSTATLDLMIGFGEEVAYHDLRASSMIATLSLPVANNAVVLPSDLLELENIYFSATVPIRVVPLERLQRLLANSTGSTTYYAAQNGDTLQFWPTASGTLLGTYYQRPADLATGGLHATFLRYPAVFIYAALTESAPFLGQDDRMPMWQAKYKEALQNANRDEQQRAYGGSGLRVRCS